MNKPFSQLVIVCRNIDVNWKQFINPIYIGVESGTLALLKNQLPIKFSCGDFDSVTEPEKEFINKQEGLEKIESPREKDQIDAEIAIIEAITHKLDFQQIVLVTEGDRWDMTFAQISLLIKYLKFNPILITTHNYVFSLQPNETWLFTQDQLEYNYISLFPLDCQEVTYNFKGCKYYDNQDVTINNKDVLAVSNEFLHGRQDVKIMIKQGQCLVILYKK